MFLIQSITAATQWPMFKYKSPFFKSIRILEYGVGKKDFNKIVAGTWFIPPCSVLRCRSWRVQDTVKRPTALAFFFPLSSSDSFIPGARLEHISFYHQSDPPLFPFQEMIYQKSREDNQLCFSFHESQLEFQQFPSLLEHGYAYQNRNSCPQIRKQLWSWNPHIRWWGWED